MMENIDLAKGPNRLVRSRYGLMLVNENDLFVGRSLIEYGEFSYAESELFAQLVAPGEVVVEVGSNIGAHTLQFADLVGHQGCVFAFEPQRLIFQMLCANLALNQVHNVMPYWAAAGETTGSILVPELDPGSVQNFGGAGLHELSGDISVPLMTIDGLGLTECHLIKADVEGMEREVLLGAKETIQRFRPLLFVENDRPEKSRALVETLLGFDYQLWWHVTFLFNPQNWNGNTTNIFEGFASANVIAVPAENECNMIGLREIKSPDDGLPPLQQI